MTAASEHIADTLDRAQKCWDAVVGIGSPDDPPSDRTHIAWFICHVTTAVLLEHLRRADPALADHLVDWLLSEGSIFADGLAGELLYQWREQLAAGQPMEPIAEKPAEETPR